MPDRISTYRQLRIVMQLERVSQSVSWSFVALDVHKGIPRAIPLDHGALGGPYRFGQTEDLVVVAADVLRQLERRWTLA